MVTKQIMRKLIECKISQHKFNEIKENNKPLEIYQKDNNRLVVQWLENEQAYSFYLYHWDDTSEQCQKEEMYRKYILLPDGILWDNAEPMADVYANIADFWNFSTCNGRCSECDIEFYDFQCCCKFARGSKLMYTDKLPLVDENGDEILPF